MRFLTPLLLTLLFAAHLPTFGQGGCTTTLESIESAAFGELAAEYKRLHSYANPYCDTTNSQFHEIMIALGKKGKSEKIGQAEIVSSMGTPYFEGTLSSYEAQKITVGRNGRQTGKALPPAYKIPTGEYYIVYLWRKKDYLVFACQGGKVVDSKWWEKGDYR